MRTTQTLIALVVAIGLTASPATAASGVLIAQKVTSGTIQSVSEVTEASRQNLPDALFQVPAGDQKREFPGLGRGRGRQ